MTLADLPWINASLNGLSALLLGAGWFAIRAGRRRGHRAFMLGALASSAVFLGCYLYYHAHVGATHFVNPPWFRPIYLVLLTSHTILAAAIVPMILVTLTRALRERFDRHRALARWTLPLWMYVSVTGVLIYLLLYQIFPQR